MLIHLLVIASIVWSGYPRIDWIMDTAFLKNAKLKDFGFDLYVVYLVWVGVVLTLYPLCKKSRDNRAENRDKWWLVICN
ncbi:hypothetical protein BFP72_12060 [Reichenbachiella sp. 5M10]|nr:hypothetical protein BFP72_12060 [Reichenbachiella sp. 5M10]